MNIEFARGDSYQKGFILKRNGTTVTDTFDDIYFTVKHKFSDHDFILQKKLSTGGIVSDGSGHYTLFIEPADTNTLDIDQYDCDIEIVKDDYKRTFYGIFKLLKEVTHYYNE